MPRTDIDAIDFRIMAALQTQGRLSNVELALGAGLSKADAPLRLDHPGPPPAGANRGQRTAGRP